MSRVNILGVEIDDLTEDEVLQKIGGFLDNKKQGYLATVNPELLVLAQKDKEFKEILNRADLAVADGIGLLYAARFLNRPLKQRITGVDLMEKICEKASQKNWQVLLFGAQEGVAEKAAQNLKKKYLNLDIMGFFTPTVVGVQNDSIRKPVILFVALGAPKQEKWIVQNLAKMPDVNLAIGVGGAFDFIAGKVKRAPLSWQDKGFEWLWRLTCQPWRLKRIFKAIVVFPWLVIKDKLSTDKHFTII